MNNLHPQPNQAVTNAPYIITMQIQTDYLHAFTVGAVTGSTSGATKNKLIPVLTSAVAHPPIISARSNTLSTMPIQEVIEQKKVVKQQKVERLILKEGVSKKQVERKSHQSQRSNEMWVNDLSNSTAPMVQQKAHEELSNYLYVVGYNYIQKRINDIQRLNSYKVEEIVELTKDFVQSFMLKLVKDKYALLDKYSGLGRFTSWAAQVLSNLIASELRKSYWQKQYMPNDGLQIAWVVDEETMAPQTTVEIEEIGETLNRLLDQLSTQQRAILLRCFANGERVADVAEELGITPNALYINAYRAKAKMRKLLEKEGITVSELAIFYT